MDRICCINCGSYDVEDREKSKDGVTWYWCVDCLFRFSNYDYALNMNFRHKILMVKYNENSVDSILATTADLMLRNGCEPDRIMDFLYGANLSMTDLLYRASYLETWLEYKNGRASK